MQRFALVVVVLGGCLSNPEVAVDQSSLDIPRGAASDVQVSIDGVPVWDLDEVLWTIEDDRLVSVVEAHDGRHLRVGGNVEGSTVVHVFAHGQDIAIPTRIGPPATLRIWTEPSSVHASVGSDVQVRAKALDTMAHVRDITFDSRWAVRDESLVNLDSSGMMLHAMDAGETTLHVQHGTYTAVVPVAIFK